MAHPLGLAGASLELIYLCSLSHSLSVSLVISIYALYDDNLDGVADYDTNVYMLAESSVHGVRIVGDKLYFSEADFVKFVPYVNGSRQYKQPAQPTVVANLRCARDVLEERFDFFSFLFSFSYSDRFTHTIDAHPITGELFVTTGQYDRYNCDVSADARVGGVLRIGIGRTPQVYVTGCRNPMVNSSGSFR